MHVLPKISSMIQYYYLTNENKSVQNLQHNKSQLTKTTGSNSLLPPQEKCVNPQHCSYSWMGEKLILRDTIASYTF